MILTNYLSHGFLIASIIVFLTLIVYFNISALMTTLDNRIVKIAGAPAACEYNDVQSIINSQKCTKGTSNGLYYITLDNTTYSLTTSMKNYLDVCKTVCDKLDPENNTCQGNDSVIGEYNTCVKNLEPPAGCNELERPLGFRFSSTDNSKVFFYAKDIIQINNCI